MVTASSHDAHNHALPDSHFCRTHIMNIMGRHMLRLMGIGAFAIAIPQLASAFDSESGAAFKLAMGPTSAALKNQTPSTTSDNTGTKCPPSEGTCPKPHLRSYERRFRRALGRVGPARQM